MKRGEPDALSRYLDGETSRAALPPELSAEADAFDRLVAAMDRRPITLPPTVRAAIMARVRAAPEPLWRRAWDWIATPRTVRFSPLAGAFAAVGLAAILLVAWPPPSPPRPAGVAPGAGEMPGRVTARFVYVAPQAATVVVTGEFAQWDPHGIPMRRGEGGTWVAEINLVPGLHHYVFIVDGNRWVVDPNATAQVDDGFGQQNSVLLIPERRATE